MNRIEAVAGVSLAALLAAGAGHQYFRLSRLAATPAPGREVAVQSELYPVRTADTVVHSFLSTVEAQGDADRLAHLGTLLAALDSPQLAEDALELEAGETLARTVSEIFEKNPDDSPEGLDIRRRAVGLIAGRASGPVARTFVIKVLEQGPQLLREEAALRAGVAGGVRGPSVYAKVKELGEKGQLPDSILPTALRRTGGAKAKEGLLALMRSTDSAKLIAGCAVALQDYRDPELLSSVLERLEQVGMLDTASRLPWISPKLLAEHLKAADRSGLKRGMMAMSARPVLVKDAVVHATRGLESPDAETRRYAAMAVKKAVVAKFVDAKQGESLLAGRLQTETEPILKAELTGGLERVRSLLEQSPTGVQ